MKLFLYSDVYVDVMVSIGSIPSSIAGLTSLQSLTLYSNKLTGMTMQLVIKIKVMMTMMIITRHHPTQHWSDDYTDEFAVAKQ